MTKLRGALVGYGFIMERGHAAGYRQRGPTARRRDRGRRRRLRRSGARSRTASARACASTTTTARCWPPRRREPRLRRHRDAALRAREGRPRGARRAGCTSCARSRWHDDRGRARHAAPRRARRARALSRATTTSTRRSIKAVRGDARRGAHRPRPPGDAADLPQHPRQGRGRAGDRLAARAALLGRRHRDGPRQPHLLSGLRVAARLPDGDHRARGDAGGVRHRGRLHLQPASFRPGVASAHLSWNAGVRKVLYTSTASAAPCASRTTASRSPRRTAPDSGEPATQLEVRARGDPVRLDGLQPRRPGSTRCSTTSRARSRAASSWGGRPRSRSCASSSSRPPTRRRATAAASCRSPGLAALAGDDVSDRRSSRAKEACRVVVTSSIAHAATSTSRRDDRRCSSAVWRYLVRARSRGRRAPRAHRRRRRQRVRWASPRWRWPTGCWSRSSTRWPRWASRPTW